MNRYRFVDFDPVSGKSGEAQSCDLCSWLMWMRSAADPLLSYWDIAWTAGWSEATLAGGNQIAVLESRRNWMTAAVLIWNDLSSSTLWR